MTIFTNAANCILAAAAALALLAHPLAAAEYDPSLATEAPAGEEPPEARLSRDEWLMRVDDARHRASAWLAEQRALPRPPDPPAVEDGDRIATERVLNDDSLQFGDIVSTRNGLFVFRGRPDRERRPGDFVALPALRNSAPAAD